MYSMRDFAGLDLGHNAIPDQTTILNFRHLLEKHKLTEALFDAVKTYLEDRALLLRCGTIMDVKTGLVHRVKTTRGKTHDAKLTDDLIRADDAIIFGLLGHATHTLPGRILSMSQKKRNKKYGTVRAKVEHVFGVIKCQFGYRKVRYRRLAKRGADVQPYGAGQPLPRATMLKAGFCLKSGKPEEHGRKSGFGMAGIRIPLAAHHPDAAKTLLFRVSLTL